jgi:hypothetical protein
LCIFGKSTNGTDFLDQVSLAGMEVLIVYQDEAVRQAMIKQLRDKHALPSPGTGALVDNLKFAKILFLPDKMWPDPDSFKPFAEKTWHIAHLEYDQPKECMNVFQNDIHPSSQSWYERNVYPFAPAQVIAQTDETEDIRLRGDRDPLWSKAFHAMLAWVKEATALIDK